MAAHSPRGARETDRDGVTRLAPPRAEGSRAGLWVLVGGVGLTLLLLAGGVWLSLQPVEGGEASLPPPEPTPERTLVPQPVPRPRAPAPSVQHPGRVVAAAGQQPLAEPSEEAVAMTSESGAGGGQRTGLALFPPPGTKPIKRGIVVPDDFELPPGYVRHFQSTDEGERLPAILMFHPDHTPVDAEGRPMPLPEDRVVPPELAPAGLPIDMLEVPGAQGTGAR